MSRNTSRGGNGNGRRNRAAAAMEDTDPMTREDILEAFGPTGPDTSTAGGLHGRDRAAPDPDPADDIRPHS